MNKFKTASRYALFLNKYADELYKNNNIEKKINTHELCRVYQCKHNVLTAAKNLGYFKFYGKSLISTVDVFGQYHGLNIIKNNSFNSKKLENIF